jgi:AcrR family transcriptional regulator
VHEHAGSNGPSRYEQLLDQAVDHVIDQGLPSLSVRTLAEALGVAHNTVTYHFGTRSQLLAAIFSRLAERIRQDTNATDPVSGTEIAEEAAVARLVSVWEWLRDPQHASMWTTFFEVFALAVREPASYRQFLDHLSADWIVPVTDQLEGIGLDRAVAEARATVLIATVRGLAMELQAAEPKDEKRINAAFDALIEVLRSWVDELPS